MNKGLTRRLPIAAIAAKVGIPNARNFSKQFARILDMNPRELRRPAQQPFVIDGRVQPLRPRRRRAGK